METLYDRSFDTWQAAQKAATDWGEEFGYTFAIHTKKPNATEPTVIIFRCSKGRPFVTSQRKHVPDSKRRQTSTQKTMCKYRFKLTLQGYSQKWVVCRIKGDTANQHNHPPGNKAVLSSSSS